MNKLRAYIPSLARVSSILAASIQFVERRDKTDSLAAADMEALRVQRLREDAQRSLSVNLAEGIALSHKLLRFTGAALKS